MNEHKSNIRIGKLLVDAGKLKLQDIEQIENCQNRHGLSFGEAALKLGLVAEADIQQMLSQQFPYPYMQAGENGVSEELIAAYQPFSPQVEILRSLRSQLMLRWFNEGNKQLSLVASGPGEGCSYLSANLAIVFSQLGERTLLIDANLRNPRQHQLFNLPQHQGLSDLLVGRADMDTIRKIPSLGKLSVLTSGAVPPNPQELLGQPAFKSLMQELAKNYDITLLDTPNGILYADIQNIVTETRGTLLVMRKHHTHMSAALALKEQIANVKAQIVGVAFNEF